MAWTEENYGIAVEVLRSENINEVLLIQGHTC